MIRHFFEESNDAQSLQEKLQKWSQDQAGSWLTPLWEEKYLKERNSLPFTSNFTILLKENQTTSAGKISFLLRELYHAIVDETLEPQLFKGKPLDMKPYINLFRSTRIPHQDQDTFYVADLDKRDNHVVILYHNHVYEVPVTDEKGVPYSAEAISQAVETTIKKVDTKGIPVTIFTAAERDEAADLYQKLTCSAINAEALQSIADALAILSIDEESETDEEALERLMLHPANKYFDKTLQIVITKNGNIGFHMEHTAVDGMMVSTVINHLLHGLEKEYAGEEMISHQPRIQKKEWELTDELTEQLTFLYKKHIHRMNDFSLLTTKFVDFGAEKIKELKLSPDAFFHMALQLAKYRTYGTFKSVYEPVSVGFFKEGRTESARASSMEKRLLVEAIESREESNENLYRMMQTASDAHAARIRDCQKGFGVERHLFGLKKMYDLFSEELGIEEKPAIFRDPGYLTLKDDFISTSGMVYPEAKARMFAPAVREGHGLAYFILDHTISLNLSSYTENEFKAKQLMKNMIIALQELRTIAESEVFVEDIS